MGVLWVVFLVLVAAKLGPAPGARAMPWAVVFVPFWLQACVLAAAPRLGWLVRAKKGVYATLMLCCWVPFVALSVAVAAKLQLDEDRGTGGADSAVPLRFAFVPVFMVDAVFLLGPAAACLYNLRPSKIFAEHFHTFRVGGTDPHRPSTPQIGSQRLCIRG